MKTKYNEAIGVVTSLLNMKKDYHLSFKCDIYNENLELFKISIDQILNDKSVHTIIINWSSNNECYEVWSNQINPYKNPDSPYPDYNDVMFNDHEKMLLYIYHLLELYSNTPTI